MRPGTEYLRENNMLSQTKLILTPSSAGPMPAPLPHRKPRYEAMAPWGITVSADQVSPRSDLAEDFDAMIAAALDAA